MRLSVALCTFNGDRFLREQLDSIQRQSRTPDEVTVSDDASTDTTWSIVERFAAAAGLPVRCRRNDQRLGSVQNFARAIAECDGDIIALADQDDVWRHDKLQRIEQAFAAPGVGLVFSDAELVDARLQPLGTTAWQALGFTRRERQRVRRGSALPLLLRKNVVVGAALAFRSTFRELVLPFPDVLGARGLPFQHDGWIAVLVSAVAGVALVDEPLIAYRCHPDQQVGIRTQRRTAAVPAPPAADRAYRLQGTAAWLEQLRSRLLAYDAPADTIAVIDDAVDHLAARLAVVGRRRGAAVAVTELARGRYHRFSAGTRSMVRDTVARLQAGRQR